MFTQTIMMHQIVNNLWLGSQDDADKLVRNNPENITAILNVRGADAYHPPGRDQSAEHPGKAYKWIPAPDIGTISPKHVREALLWLREQTDKNERILLHCKYGISRLPRRLHGGERNLSEPGGSESYDLGSSTSPAGDADCGTCKACFVDLRADRIA